MDVKYKIELGSFCTRMVTRKIVVHAENEAEASEKAIDKYIKMEQKVFSSVDFGEPHVDFIDKIDS
jgi:hypothetical protein